MRVAGATVRNLRNTAPFHGTLPAHGGAWRDLISRQRNNVTLYDLVDDLWLRGIPVIPLEVLPSPSFQGLAGIIDGRPVIVLGYRHDEPGRIAFFVSHEAGHIAAGDCAPNQPVVDEDEDVQDTSESERRADQYAISVLLGGENIPSIEGNSFKEIARRAIEAERTTGADATALIFRWAARVGTQAAYQTATLAVKALYRGSGGRTQLRRLFDRYVDLSSATETDRALLRCVYGEQELDEAAG